MHARTHAQGNAPHLSSRTGYYHLYYMLISELQHNLSFLRFTSAQSWQVSMAFTFY